METQNKSISNNEVFSILNDVIAHKDNLTRAKELVFEAIADLMPSIGRDFDVSVKLSENGNAIVNMKSYTLIGEMFVRYLYGNLINKINELTNKKFNESESNEEVKKIII